MTHWHLTLFCEMKLEEKLQKSMMKDCTVFLKKLTITTSLTTGAKVDSCVLLGHQISAEGITPLSSEIHAILKMPQPKDITQLRSFLGSVNHLMKFLPRPRLTDLDYPRELLQKDSLLQWSTEHDMTKHLKTSRNSSWSHPSWHGTTLPYLQELSQLEPDTKV